MSTVTVRDGGEWIKDIPIDDINPLFAESGWNMERELKEDGLLAVCQCSLKLFE